MVGSIFKTGGPFFASKPGAPSIQATASQPGTVPQDPGVIPPVAEVAPSSAMTSMGRAEAEYGLQFQRALADPALTEPYRDLLKQLYAELAASDQQDGFVALERTTAWPELRRALITEHVQFEYNRLVKPDVPVVSAVERALVTLIGRDALEPLLHDIAEAADVERLQNPDYLQEEIDTLLEMHAESLDMYYASITKRDKHYRHLRVIERSMRHFYRAYNKLDIHTRVVDSVDRNYPELSPQWKQRIVWLRERGEEVDALMDIGFRRQLWAAIGDSYQEFLTWVIDSMSDDRAHQAAGKNGLTFMSVGQSFHTYALQQGVSLDDLRTLISDLEYPHLGREVSLQELAAGKAVMVEPKHLPPDVLKVLSVTGYRDDFFKWVDHVALVDRIRLTEQQQNFVGMDADALADILGKMVIVKYLEVDLYTGKIFPMPAWKIAALAAHEGVGHIMWMHELPGDKRLRGMLIESVPNERNAYCVEADVCRRWLEHLKQTQGDEGQLTLKQQWDRLALEQHIFERESLISASNLLLGLNLNNTTPGEKDYQVRSCFSGMVDRVDRMNLSDYPTKVRVLMSEIEHMGNRDDQFQLLELRETLAHDLRELDRKHQELVAKVQSGEMASSDSITEQEAERLISFLRVAPAWHQDMANTLGLG